MSTIIESIMVDIVISSLFFMMDGASRSGHNDSLREKIKKERDPLRSVTIATILPTIQDLDTLENKDKLVMFLRSQDVSEIVQKVLTRKIHRSENSLSSLQATFNAAYSRHVGDQESPDVPNNLWKAMLDGCEAFLKDAIDDEELKFLASILTVQYEEVITAVNDTPKKTVEELKAHLSPDLFKQNIANSGDFFDVLDEYIARKLALLNKTKWPYDIDKRSFIKVIDIAKGDLLDISADDLEHEIYSSGDCDCLSYVEQQIHMGSMVCIGHYGMGKSTISKMLFKEWSAKKELYPILLTLSYVDLIEYCSCGLENRVVDEIEKTLQLRIKGQSIPKLVISNRGIFRDKISEMVGSQKLLLILDGIDESMCDTCTIVRFIKDLSNKNCRVFLTCRLEFTPFFDAIEYLRGYDEDVYVELSGIRLLDWRKPQWEKYAKGLHDKYPDKRDIINDFTNSVIDEKYSSLPTRPLFFKMLSDLIVNNQTEYKISLQLQSNLAEIYYKFLRWKILDDLNRKGSSFSSCDRKRFETEAFNLLRDLSLCQYKGNLKGTAKGVELDIIKKLCCDRNFDIIFEKQIVDILLYSSLFSIIRRLNVGEFVFSHKSFMEYLVAHNIADGLLTKRGADQKPECNMNWGLFQTHEVSDHLMDEIERIRITYDLTEEERNDMLLYAFQSALEEVADPFHYDARIEEILYYIGKFRIESPKILSHLRNLTENQELCPEDYYRTASITLSRVVDPGYCENYVLGLLDDIKKGGSRFELNKKIQLRYYGEANIRRALKRDLDKYIARDSQSCIISLKILTYFTAIPQKQNEILLERDYLQKIIEVAREKGDNKIQEICERIDSILDSVTRNEPYPKWLHPN